MANNNNADANVKGYSNKDNFDRITTKDNNNSPKVNGGTGKGNNSNRNSHKPGKPNNNRNRHSNRGTVPTNSPIYYSLNPSMVKDSASINFNSRVGAPLTTMYNGMPVYNAPGNILNSSFPGVCNFRVVTGPGIAQKSGDPINTVATMIYQQIRASISGQRDYDRQDVIAIITAGYEVPALMSYIQRAYGFQFNWSANNKYKGEAMAKMSGVATTDLANNAANFRIQWSKVAGMFNALNIPNVGYLAKRWFELYSGVYKDEDTDRAQMYMFSPYGCRLLEEVNPEVPGSGFYLKYQTFAPEESIFTLLGIAEDMCQRLLDSEDFATITGDIRKAYPNAALMMVPEMDALYVPPMGYDATVLSQIENATIFEGADERSLDITVSTDTLNMVYQPKFKIVDGGVPWMGRILNYHDDTSTEPINNIEASRFTVWINKNDTDLKDEYRTGVLLCSPKAIGSEVLVGARIYAFSATQELDFADFTTFEQLSNNSCLYHSLLTHKFAHFPALLISFFHGDAWKYVDINQDIDVYSELSESAITGMHNTAILSEWGVSVAQGALMSGSVRPTSNGSK